MGAIRGPGLAAGKQESSPSPSNAVVFSLWRDEVLGGLAAFLGALSGHRRRKNGLALGVRLELPLLPGPSNHLERTIALGEALLQPVCDHTFLGAGVEVAPMAGDAEAGTENHVAAYHDLVACGAVRNRDGVARCVEVDLANTMQPSHVAIAIDSRRLALEVFGAVVDLIAPALQHLGEHALVATRLRHFGRRRGGHAASVEQSGALWSSRGPWWP